MNKDRVCAWEREKNNHKKTEVSEKENREHLTSYINVGHTRTSSSKFVSSHWRKTKTNSTPNINTRNTLIYSPYEMKQNEIKIKQSLSFPSSLHNSVIFFRRFLSYIVQNQRVALERLFSNVVKVILGVAYSTVVAVAVAAAAVFPSLAHIVCEFYVVFFLRVEKWNPSHLKR